MSTNRLNVIISACINCGSSVSGFNFKGHDLADSGWFVNEYGHWFCPHAKKIMALDIKEMKAMVKKDRPKSKTVDEVLVETTSWLYIHDGAYSVRKDWRVALLDHLKRQFTSLTS